MPRRMRLDTKGMVFHAMNRGAKRSRLFDTNWDYAAFEDLIVEAKERVPIKLFAYCLMPNHWHFVIVGQADGQRSQFFHWLTGTHASRWNAFDKSVGPGAVYQGRFKAIPVQRDQHLLRVIRYVERNPLRANLVTTAEDWRWSSLWRRSNFCQTPLLDEWPIPTPPDWLGIVNQPESEGELDSLREAITRGAPFGESEWRSETARLLGTGPSLRPVGRPRREVQSAEEETLPDPFLWVADDSVAGDDRADPGSFDERVDAIGIGGRTNDDQTDAHIERAEHLSVLDAAALLQDAEKCRHLPRRAIDLRRAALRQDPGQIVGNAAAGDV